MNYKIQNKHSVLLNSEKGVLQRSPAAQFQDLEDEQMTYTGVGPLQSVKESILN